MLLEPFIDISQNLINGAVGVTTWALTPIEVFGLSIMPIATFSFSFLIAYLVFAIIRWLI